MYQVKLKVVFKYIKLKLYAKIKVQDSKGKEDRGNPFILPKLRILKKFSILNYVGHMFQEKLEIHLSIFPKFIEDSHSQPTFDTYISQLIGNQTVVCLKETMRNPHTWNCLLPNLLKFTPKLTELTIQYSMPLVQQIHTILGDI